MSEGSSSKRATIIPIRRGDVDVGQQLPLLPLRIEADSPARFGSADLKTIVRTHDRHDYAVKSVSDGPLLPASEFLCYKLAAACNLPVPFSAILEMRPGEYAFGSRFEGGITERAAMGPQKQLEAFRDAAEPISAILAFDLFIGNEDRHRGNFLFRKNLSDQWVPLAIDYSRAFLVRGFPDDEFPMSQNSNTRLTIDALKKADMWKGPFAVFAVTSLQSVEQSHLQHWFDEMPASWMSPDERARLLNWWQSAKFKERIGKLFNLL